MSKTESFVDFSISMADAAEVAAQSVLQVRSGRWRPTAGTVCMDEHVLVADHALEHDENVGVRDARGAVLDAILVGRDPSTDLALLKVAGLRAAPARRPPSPPRVGQIALAIGRAWSGGVVAGLGVVSSIGGPWRTGRGPAVEQVIRTDATPYPGFAGGALAAADGSCLGIATGVLLRGLGLVIPASIAWPVAETLARHGRIRRAFLGISGQPVRLPSSGQPGAPGRGILIVSVSDDSPAARADLMLGDVLTALNGQQVGDPETLLSLLTGDLLDRPVAVDLVRAGERRNIEVTLSER